MRALAVVVALAAPARADLPPIARDVDIEEHLGQKVPLDLPFVDADGRPTTLGRQFVEGKPVLLVLAYLRCPSLCDLVLRGLVDSVAKSALRPDADFRAVTLSIDPKDTPPQARLRQIALLQTLGLPHASWPFLVGKTPQIKELAAQLGFLYAYDPRSDQYAHPAVVFVLTPDGRISRYLYGVRFRPLDLELALSEASRGRVGGIVGRVLLTCFRWDPAARKYGFVVSGVMRGGAALVLLLVAGGLFYLFRLERRRAA